MNAPLFRSPQEHTLFWTRLLAERAARLQRLTELRAPGLILCQARELVFKALVRVPADPEYLLQNDNLHEEMRAQEQEHLQKTGFYDDTGA